MNNTNSSSSIQLGLPPLHLFYFPPTQPQKTAIPLPPTVPTTSKFLRPVSINSTIFDISLDLQFPLTIAVIYLSAVLLLNRINASRQYRPWGFSKKPTFRAFVVVHNALLALFSAWTFFGICHALKNCWPGQGPNYYTHIAEVICETDSKAASCESSQYTTTNYPMMTKLTDFVVLPSANVNTVWEEGSAYIGWIFYMSKFYEVLDTMVILARGKKSSLLQTYHHAGVMLCGWASLKYESPALLVGIVLNSGIHTLMSLGFAIPMTIKRSLTSLQIAQFLAGFVWGYAYFFVKYTVPFDAAVSQTTSANSHGDYGVSAIDGAEEVGYGRVVSCLSDSGEAFTILLTTAYVLPLLLLFVRFFIASYSKSKTV
ncbi:uncharacterized protein N7506_003478 [Penicillium brevicompactum]|uniref:uncharacterized protein n=1 Tax=Penicillium brevicompactum TaxID=5074 RepID=UPI0025410F2A|nr:uncharacterized protein N7506_003478 [Penicillium brevicompactum]KAJ5343654.1 hypothetical protein N7506_003478 [Penicillium brevicompactum]